MVLKNKTILVTGSTDGLGRWIAREVADRGAFVIVHGRNKVRGEELLEEIHAAEGRAELHTADFASLGEVRKLAEVILKNHDHLDILINNAGIGGFGPREMSRDGFELRFAVNYLAGFLLTSLLIPLIPFGGRILNVASVGQQPIDFSDVQLIHGYDAFRAYAQSKLAQILFTFDLAEELKDKGIAVNCLHPATFMDTTMVRNAGVRPMSSVEDGGKAVLNLILSKDGMTGVYFDQMHQSRAHRQAYDAEARRKLWELSCQLTQENLDQL